MKHNPTELSFPSDKEIKMTHVFDAPRELVYNAYTNPHFIPKWWGPRSLETNVDYMEVRPGGTWRIVQRDTEGNEYAFHGEYLEIELYKRLVQTFNYVDMPGHEGVETAIFEDIDTAKTRITTTSKFKTVEDRDGMYNSGMEEGLTESMERLDELLQGLVDEGACEIK
jgi:uncharacterized protein YndB with AHSA1/START domain